MKYIVLILLFLFNHTLASFQNDSTLRNGTIITDTTKDLTTKQLVVSDKSSLAMNEKNYKNKSFWDLEFSFTAIMAMIGAILGLLLSTTTLYDKFLKKPKVFSKIISFYCSDGEFLLKIEDEPKQMYYGIRYVLKLLINITKENLNYTDVKVFVKFNGDINEYEGRIHSPRNFQFCRIGNENFKLNLPHNKLIYYTSVLEKDKSSLGYITFIVLDNENKFKNKWQDIYNRPYSIRLDFKGSNNKIYSSNEMRLMKEEEKYLWEDSIWTKVQ